MLTIIAFAEMMAVTARNSGALEGRVSTVDWTAAQALGNTSAMNIRPYVPSDSDALAAIYRDAVEGLGAVAYAPAQIRVWAGFADDREAFQARLSQGFALVATCDGGPAAFCHLHPVDHISLLYTATRYARQGLATALYAGCELHARQEGQHRLSTDASKLSRPFFEGQGFKLCAVEVVDREGVSFERYTMEKSL